MSMHRLAPAWFAVALCCAGCNTITGADGLSIGGDGTSSAAGGGGHGTQPPAEPVPYLAGASITDIDLYQGIRRPLVQSGELVSSDIPVVAGRSGMLRIFYSATPAAQGRDVVAVVRLSGAQPIKRGAVLGASSEQTDLDSTINVEIPGELLAPATSFSVALLDASGQGDPSNQAAAFPPTSDAAPLQVRQGGRTLRLVLVAIDYHGSLPDTSEARLDRYGAAVLARYPVPEVQIELRDAALGFDGDLGTEAGWQELLDAVTALRVADQAPDDTYYYGLHTDDALGMEGLSWVNTASDPMHRAGVGLGVSDERAEEALVHELGHMHGRDHSPCNVVGDPAYPHPDGSTGVWGLDLGATALLGPADHYDFMGYCQPSWVSDFTFTALFDRLAEVSVSPDVTGSPAAMPPQRYQRWWLRGQTALAAGSLMLPHPPAAEPVMVSARTTATADAPPDEPAQGWFVRYDHLDGGVLYVPADGVTARATMQDELQVGASRYAVTH